MNHRCSLLCFGGAVHFLNTFSANVSILSADDGFHFGAENEWMWPLSCLFWCRDGCASQNHSSHVHSPTEPRITSSLIQRDRHELRRVFESRTVTQTTDDDSGQNILALAKKILRTVSKLLSIAMGITFDTVRCTLFVIMAVHCQRCENYSPYAIRRAPVV